MDHEHPPPKKNGETDLLRSWLIITHHFMKAKTGIPIALDKRIRGPSE